MKESFQSFLMRNRFKAWDLINPRELTIEDYNLSTSFNGLEFLWLSQKHDELRRLGTALMLAQYVAECKTDQNEIFSQLVSYLRDDEWKFTLRFCPYHKVDVAIKNLEVIQSAMDDSCIGLSSAKAGMETAVTHGKRGNASYEREQSKATAQILNFSALYASYVDVCWRIRDYCKLTESNAYKRAILRLTTKNSGAHSFFKDLRNFMLHYHIQAPGLTTIYGEHKVSVINLNSADMLYSGFKWKNSSREFLQSHESIDILESASSVVEDVGKVVEFHKYLISRSLKNEDFAYKYYLSERKRLKHLQKSVSDINAIFGKKTPLLERLSSKEFAIEMASTQLSDKQLKSLIFNHANRYANLPKKVVNQLKDEIDNFVMRRPRYPTGGAYLSLRKYN